MPTGQEQNFGYAKIGGVAIGAKKTAHFVLFAVKIIAKLKVLLLVLGQNWTMKRICEILKKEKKYVVNDIVVNENI